MYAYGCINAPDQLVSHCGILATSDAQLCRVLLEQCFSQEYVHDEEGMLCPNRKQAEQRRVEQSSLPQHVHHVPLLKLQQRNFIQLPLTADVLPQQYHCDCAEYVNDPPIPRRWYAIVQRAHQEMDEEERDAEVQTFL